LLLALTCHGRKGKAGDYRFRQTNLPVSAGTWASVVGEEIMVMGYDRLADSGRQSALLTRYVRRILHYVDITQRMTATVPVAGSEAGMMNFTNVLRKSPALPDNQDPV
jgi:hypothetical protein